VGRIGGGLILADYILSPGVPDNGGRPDPRGADTLLAPEPQLKRCTAVLSRHMDPWSIFPAGQRRTDPGVHPAYKIGDTMAAAITTPFYLELGFSKSEIGAVVKLFALGPRLPEPSPADAHAAVGIQRSLWVFGVLRRYPRRDSPFSPHRLQPSCAFRGDRFRERHRRHGTSAFVAFMASQTNKSSPPRSTRC